MVSPKPLKRSLTSSFVIVTLLPMLVISFLVLYDLMGERARDIDEKSLMLAKAVSGQIEGFLREPLATLQSIGGVLRAHPDMRDSEIQNLLDTIVDNSNLFESIYIIDKEGNTRFIGLRPERIDLKKDFLGINLSHRPFFKETSDTGEPAWSDTFFSVISGEISLALTYPVGDGMLVGNFSIRPLTEFVQKLQGSDNIIISVVDRTGTTIAHPDPALAAQQVHVGHLAPVQAALEDKEVTLHYIFDQQDYLGSSVPIPGPNWAVLVSQPSVDAYRQVRNTGYLFAAGGLGALLLSIIFALSKTFRLSRPLSELTLKTDIIAGGQYDVSFTESGYVEFDNLAGNVRHMATAIRDREEQLTKSRERYRLLVETMTDGLIVFDPNGTITYVNPGFSRMIDYLPTDITGRQVGDFLDSGNLQALQQQLTGCENGCELSFELVWNRADGDLVSTTMSTKSLFEEGRFIGSFAVVSDITARKKAEMLVAKSLTEAEEARDKVDAILKSVPLGLIVTNMQGRIILMNRIAEKSLGQSFEELKYQPIESALQEIPFQNHFAAAITGQGNSEPIDLDLFDHGLGRTRTVQISSALVQSQEEVQTGLITILNDVTGERESDRMKSEFIATAAHELSTPLTAIMGYAELLLNQEESGAFPPEQLKEFYTTIHDRSEALNRITEDLLHLSHMESGRTILLDKEIHDIDKTIQSVVNQYRQEFPDRTFNAQINSSTNELSIDRGRIIQVLENLIGNAVKYSHENGTVTIEGAREDDCYRIDVIDSGIGMTPEQVERIFEKFYRANPLHASISGLGMGMSIVKNIIDAHKGQIKVISRLGEGTRVSIRLPLS